MWVCGATTRTLIVAAAAYLTSSASASPPRVTPASVASLVQVSAEVREADGQWFRTPAVHVRWRDPAQLRVRSPSHEHRMRVIPRKDGFELSYFRDGTLIFESIDVAAHRTVVRGSSEGAVVVVHVESN